jgi:GNAT superfamily N-acetyltransferase
MKLEPFGAIAPAAAAAIWNAACGPDLAIRAQAVEYNTSPTTGGLQSGRAAFEDGRPVGFVLASMLQGDPVVASPQLGWLDAIAVVPQYQRRGIGSALLDWAEGWLSEHGATRMSLGASMRPFTPGLPLALGDGGFFRKRGFAGRPGHERAWDLAHDLRDYITPPTACKAGEVQIRPVRPGEEEAILGFLRREFPGRWRFEFEAHLCEGGRISDFMALWTERGVDGCCLLTLEDSRRPLDRFFPYALPRPWGQLGSIGVSADTRGKGYGAALLDGGLRCLKDAGVAGCVIDWTGLLDFYGKFGFKPYREYLMLRKTLEA